MVKKIIFAGILLCLFISIPLALLGYKQVELGTPFLALMRSVNNDLANFKIAIPDIPTIPNIPYNSSTGDEGILEVLINLANGIINFFNAIITIINVFIQVINIIIQLIEVIVLIVKNLITFKDTIASYNPIIVT